MQYRRRAWLWANEKGSKRCGQGCLGAPVEQPCISCELFLGSGEPGSFPLVLRHEGEGTAPPLRLEVTPGCVSTKLLLKAG